MEHYSKRLLCYFVFTLSIYTSFSQIISLETKHAKKGGGNGTPCFICFQQVLNDMEIKFVPDHYPFKIDKVIYSNTSSNGMNIYYGQPIVYPNGEDMYFVKNKNYYPATNQVIDQNSPFINSDGSIVISVALSARYCINSNFYNSPGQFRHSVTIHLNDVDPASGSSIHSYKFTGIVASNYLYNCNNTLPYEIVIYTPRKKLSNTNSIQIFPNPARERLNILFPIPYSKDISISLFDPIKGKIYQDIKFNPN
ncbi:MAG: hypothetical protein AAFR87_23075, partial [Bacteroidota bacterium]